MMLGPHAAVEEAAGGLRNWDTAFIAMAVDKAIPERQLALDIKAYFERVGFACKLRHRMIHDEMGVGISEDERGGLTTILVRRGFIKLGRKTSMAWTDVLPDDVAALATHFYDLRLEIDTLIGRWRDL